MRLWNGNSWNDVLYRLLDDNTMLSSLYEDGKVCNSSGTKVLKYNNKYVYKTDEIIEGATYQWEVYNNGGGGLAG